MGFHFLAWWHPPALSLPHWVFPVHLWERWGLCSSSAYNVGTSWRIEHEQWLQKLLLNYHYHHNCHHSSFKIYSHILLGYGCL
jgi:hypothetical protein